MAITCNITMNGLAAKGLYVRFVSLDIRRDENDRFVAQWVAAYRQVVEVELTEEVLQAEYFHMLGERPSFDAYKLSRLASVPKHDEWYPIASGRTLVSSYETAVRECYEDLAGAPGISHAKAVIEAEVPAEE